MDTLDTQSIHQEIDITAKLPIVIINDRTANGIDPELRSQATTNGLLNSSYTNNNSNGNGRVEKKSALALSWRVSTNESYCRRKSTKAADIKRGNIPGVNCYYHYKELTEQQLLELVEYDMDEADVAWLQKFNEKNSRKLNYKVTADDFEKIMDRLEKESTFESKHMGDIDEDADCAICNDGEVDNTNAILFCDMCNLAVHQECYGIPYVPEGQWLCRRCLQSPSTNVECCLCPNKGGAFKQTDDNRWAHVICALWIPEVCFANTVFLEPIDSIRKIPQARWKLNCYICKQKKVGACIQCHKANCYVPFHVTCAQQAGLYMKIQPFKYDTADGIMSDVKKEAFCDAHGPRYHNAGSGMYSSQDSSDEDDEDRRMRNHAAREKMKKTRKKLAGMRTSALNPVAVPSVKEEKLTVIANLLGKKHKKGRIKLTEELRETFIKEIFEYWKQKREKRNGVPLLRRLQVSYSNSIVKTGSNMKSDEAGMTRLRYDLEKARLLVGMVKKREILKSKLIILGKEMFDQQVDDEIKNPPED